MTRKPILNQPVEPFHSMNLGTVYIFELLLIGYYCTRMETSGCGSGTHN